MSKWILIVGSVVTISAIVAVFVGQARERAKAGALVQTLIQSPSQPLAGTVDFDSFSELPPPVARYFRYALTNGQESIKSVRMRQSGLLRTSTTSGTWSSFTAHQVVVPPATGFVWNARVEMPFAVHLRVLDSYSAGVGVGRISILSAFAVASESGGAELNSGALHRYLAEAVWYPTALLPRFGVVWSSIDDRSATATLTHGGATVSLVFRFNEADEVEAIYSYGRFGRFEGVYKQVPWEGHFRDYQTREGMRIPTYGEVGWYENEVLHLVWKGSLVDAQYRFVH